MCFSCHPHNRASLRRFQLRKWIPTCSTNNNHRKKNKKKKKTLNVSRKTSSPRLRFGLRSRFKKSHPIPSKSSLQSGNGSLGPPFVPWVVPAVYHINLTNCKIHTDSFSSFYIFKSAARKRFASSQRWFNYKITLCWLKWQAGLCLQRLPRQQKGHRFNPAAANVSINSFCPWTISRSLS